jgi:phage tail sheath protein FI
MATETILSPGVLLQEVDKSFTSPSTDPSGMAIIGPTAKGPVEIPTEIKSYDDFKQIFGTTIQSGSQKFEYFTNLSIKNYFINGGSSALVVRVVSGSESWGTAGNTHLSASAKASTEPFTLKTIGKGTIFNNAVDSTTAPELFSNGRLKSGSVDNVRWEVLNKNNAQGTFTLVVRRGDDTTASPLVLEQYTELSLDPNSENYISKRIGDTEEILVLDSETGDYLVESSGSFPNKSKYIRVDAVNLPTYNYIGNGNTVNSDATGTSYSASLPINGSGSFFGGLGSVLSTVQTENRYSSQSSTSGDNIQGLTSASYNKAVSLLKDKENYKFKTLVVPGLNQEQHSGLIDNIISNTTSRGDSFFVLDLVPYNSSISTVTGEAGELDSSFAGAYWPWVQVRSQELGRNIWCPASTIIPGLYSKNDSIAAPWFAPAGDIRGRVGNLIAKTETKLQKSDRDTLYSGKVNPIATFIDTGIVVFGQKTLQQDKSALDRINVRRLLLDVKDTIGEMADSIVFEQNTQQTRDRFVRQVTPYLESLVQRQGVYAFQVKMDGQLNTPDVIDQNKLVGQVFLQPTKTAEFVVLDFILTPTGASFID